MQSVHLVAGGIQVSQLSFGCGSLMASLGRDASRALLQTAADAGVTHFDVARSYGYGEAEELLGDFINGRRRLFTVTTKFGIAPPRVGGGTLKSLAREAARRLPAIRPLLRKTAGGLVRSSRFDVKSARTSFETSLRKLRTDYVDVLLMHEPSHVEVGREEMLRFLEDSVKGGMARCVGAALTSKDVESVIGMHLQHLQVLQFPSPAVHEKSLSSTLESGKFVFVHSAIGLGLKVISPLLKNEALRNQASDILGLDLADQEKLGMAVLAAAVSRNPSGSTIFSSRSIDHLKVDAQASEFYHTSSDRIRMFIELLIANLESETGSTRQSEDLRA